MRRAWQILALVSVTFLPIGCTEQAPHSNMLDPASPLYDASADLKGKCSPIYSPDEGVPSVNVLLQSLSPEKSKPAIITQTNSAGEYNFEHIEPDSYRVVFQKVNYADDTARVALQPRRAAVLNMRLDALPKIDSLRLVTGHEIYTPTGENRFYLDFTIFATDPDRNLDIEDVICKIDLQGITFPLIPNADHSVWQKLVRLDSIGIEQPDLLIGVPLHFEITTGTHSTRRRVLFGPYMLTRFIYEQIRLIAPAHNEMVGNRPIFRWVRPNTTFPFKYWLEINRILSPGEFETTIIPNFSADSSLVSPVRLLRGDYFWNLTLFDNLHNWSRSQDEQFTVSQ